MEKARIKCSRGWWVLVAVCAASCGKGSARTDGGGGAAGTVATGGGGGTTGGESAGSAGASGTTGTAGTTGAGTAAAIAGGYACPDPPPDTGDACPNDSVTCMYATKSCACYTKQWQCIDCPASQPAAPENCGAVPYRVSMNCRYGNVTCSCDRRTNDYAWHCGACPSVEPLTGDLCGNVTTGRCLYGADGCACDASGKWLCETASCPQNPLGWNIDRSPRACTSRYAAYTCHYAERDQDCICVPDAQNAITSPCSCPTRAPADGSPCIGPGTCAYGEVACSCLTERWHCVGPPADPCPTTQPSAGSSCSVRVSLCVYGSTTCSCDGTSWSCA